MTVLLRERVKLQAKTIHEEKKSTITAQCSYLDRSKIILSFMYTLYQKEETRGNFESLVRKGERRNPPIVWVHFLFTVLRGLLRNAMPFFSPFLVQIYPLLPCPVNQPLQLHMKIANHRSSTLYLERIIIIISIITLAWLWKKQFVYYTVIEISQFGTRREKAKMTLLIYGINVHIFWVSFYHAARTSRCLKGRGHDSLSLLIVLYQTVFRWGFQLNFGFEVAYNMYSICYSPINLAYKHSWPLHSYYLVKFDIASVMVTSSEINGINQEGYPATNIVISHSFLTDTIYHQC